MDSWLAASPADRARTLLALHGQSSWRLDPDDESVVLPFVDERGTPVLLADQATAERLLEQYAVSTVLSSPGPAGGDALGSVRVTGWPRLPHAAEYDGAIAVLRRDHADCGPGCDAASAVPVAVEVAAVAVTGPHDQAYAPTFEAVSLIDFWTGQVAGDLVAAHHAGLHLTDHHAADLVQLAVRATATPPDLVLAVTVARIRPEALVLSLLDPRGATEITIPFRQPLRTVADLGSELPRLLRDATELRG